MALDGQRPCPMPGGWCVRDDSCQPRVVVASCELLVAATRQPRLRPAVPPVVDVPAGSSPRYVVALRLGLSLLDTASGVPRGPEDVAGVLDRLGLVPGDLRAQQAPGFSDAVASLRTRSAISDQRYGSSSER